ncbi:protein LIFEGUARD 4-like [Rutidosis leptorrhynchoides]|uniref:protein LIFEGUARD 4-like n=1 Tax=Rutidosis leptorrhynchoides TaxID=125765 RepID=UPI003A98EABE
MGKRKQHDIEAGKHYPTQMEDPQLRWGFIRKVYSILTLQLLLTVIVASIVVVTPRINQFFRTRMGLIVYLIIFIITIIAHLVKNDGVEIDHDLIFDALDSSVYLFMKFFAVMFTMSYFMSRHPTNIILLGVFTVLFSIMVGVACVFSKANVILEASILTMVLVVSLTLFTFWVAKRGYDFNFLWPFLFCTLILVLLFSMIQEERIALTL